MLSLAGLAQGKQCPFTSKHCIHQRIREGCPDPFQIRGPTSGLRRGLCLLSKEIMSKLKVVPEVVGSFG